MKFKNYPSAILIAINSSMLHSFKYFSWINLSMSSRLFLYKAKITDRKLEMSHLIS